MKNVRRLACLAVMAAIGFSSTSAPAHAAFKMTLDDGIASDLKTLSDNDLSGGNTLDVNPVLGAVTFVGSVGTWNVNVTTGVSKPILGDPSTAGTIDLSTLNVTLAGSGTLTITLTDTDFTQVGANTLTNVIGGTISGHGFATAQAWMDPNNTEFGTGSGTSTPGPLGPFNAPLDGISTNGFTAQASTADTVTSPYSMTLKITLTSTGGLTFSADDAVSNVVPEPSTVAMALTGVPFLAVVALRRRKQSRA